MTYRRRILTGLVLVVVAAGVWVGYTAWQRHRADEAAVEQLAGNVAAELQKEEPARERLEELLRAAKDAPVGEDRRVVRARAQLEFALGRLQAAWDTIAPLVLAPDPEPEELWVAARVKLRLHGQRGDADDAYQALGFAERHYDATGDVDSGFLAWQSAQRAGAEEAKSRLAEALTADHAGSPQADLVAAFGDPATKLQTLRDLEKRFTTHPAELDFAIAYLLTESEESEANEEALARLQRVLVTYPAWVDARAVLVVALHRAGDRKRRDLHLQWLLDEAPQDDERRAQWQWLLAQPVENGR